MENKSLPEWTPVAADGERDALSVMKTDFERIDELTDRLIALSDGFGSIGDTVDKLWDSAMSLYYTAKDEIESLRNGVDE